MTIMYKVLRVKGNRLSSWGYNAAAQEYKKGEWNFPLIPNSKLFVFEKLEDAIDYSEDGTLCEVYSVEVTNPTIAEYINWWGSDFEGFVRFWNEYDIITRFLTTTPPKGTYLVDSLKLVDLLHTSTVVGTPRKV